MIRCQSQLYVSRVCIVEGSFVPEKSAYLHGQEGSYRAPVFDYELEKSALVPHGRSGTQQLPHRRSEAG